MLELDKNNEFVKSVFDYIETGSIDNTVKIFREKELENNLLITNIFIEPYTEFWNDNWIESNLKPFLTDTQLIIAGGDLFNTAQIYNSNFEGFDCTWRAWGGILAEWLNDSKIVKPLVGRNKSTRWQYIDFYMDSYLSQWIKDYEKWAKAILEIITEKDKIFGNEYKPIDE